MDSVNHDIVALSEWFLIRTEHLAHPAREEGS